MCNPISIVRTESNIRELLKAEQEMQKSKESKRFDVKPAKDDFEIIKETRFTNR